MLARFERSRGALLSGHDELASAVIEYTLRRMRAGVADPIKVASLPDDILLSITRRLLKPPADAPRTLGTWPRELDGFVARNSAELASAMSRDEQLQLVEKLRTKAGIGGAVSSVIRAIDPATEWALFESLPWQFADRRSMDTLIGKLKPMVNTLVDRRRGWWRIEKPGIHDDASNLLLEILLMEDARYVPEKLDPSKGFNEQAFNKIGDTQSEALTAIYFERLLAPRRLFKAPAKALTDQQLRYFEDLFEHLPFRATASLEVLRSLFRAIGRYETGSPQIRALLLARLIAQGSEFSLRAAYQQLERLRGSEVDHPFLLDRLSDSHDFQGGLRKMTLLYLITDHAQDVPYQRLATTRTELIELLESRRGSKVCSSTEAQWMARAIKNVPLGTPAPEVSNDDGGVFFETAIQALKAASPLSCLVRTLTY